MRIFLCYVDIKKPHSFAWTQRMKEYEKEYQASCRRAGTPHQVYFQPLLTECMQRNKKES